MTGLAAIVGMATEAVKRGASACLGRAWVLYLPEQAGVTQLAECLLPKQDVEGSNPFTRSSLIYRAIPDAVALVKPPFWSVAGSHPDGQEGGFFMDMRGR